MDATALLERISLGEDSTTQFKENITNNSNLAEEMVAFANSAGGFLIIGVGDTGNVCGLSAEDIRRLNNMVSNVASDHVKPPISPVTQVIKLGDKKVLLIEIKQGISKPYSTNSGAYITKSGADKRRISQEELQRLFQDSQKIHADELLVYGSKINDINEKTLADYYSRAYGAPIEEQEISRETIMENLYLAKNGVLTMAGLLLFGKQPQLLRPSFVIKAVSFAGNELEDVVYRDSEDISGNIAEMYQKGLGFLMRNLRRLQFDKSVNSVGDLEVPKIVLEELFVNALVHRDYFIEAPIKLFIFDNRIEISSPGKLPNNLNVDNIRYGISVFRNPIIASFAAKLLPYRGIGSGIVRATKAYSDIKFINDVSNERFTVVINRIQQG